jgi:hypothetical protein
MFGRMNRRTDDRTLSDGVGDRGRTQFFPSSYAMDRQAAKSENTALLRVF